MAGSALRRAKPPAISGCGSHGFPEDRRIGGPFQITTDWQTIRFDPPLRINREGLQVLHFVVDQELYDPNNMYDIEDTTNHFSLRRTDDVLVRPEVVLIGDNNQEVVVSPISNIRLFSGGLTIGFSTYIDHFTPSPPFPEGISTFQAMRVRSNEPFEAQYLYWRMNYHPDYHRCGGRRCRWWEKLL